MATSRFSDPTSKSKFKKHHVHEVSTSLAESKQIANDYAENHRYAHRATALVVGTSTIRPFDPVYIDGVPNGLSGYWTVLEVKHVFGGSIAPYMLELELGTDTIGDVNPNAKYTSEERNINNELAGKDLSSSESVLASHALKVNAHSFAVKKPVVSPRVSKPVSQYIDPSANPYHHTSTTPDYGISPRTSTWVAKKANKTV